MATVQQIAMDIFPVLVNSAKASGKLSYGDVAERIGRPRSEGRLLAVPLKLLHEWCSIKQLPALTVIVVNQRANEIGGWLLERISNPDLERSKVYRFDWSQIAPSIGDLNLNVAG